MSIVKSISVGDGDMFYILHNTDSFTIIDCCLSDDNKAQIVRELVTQSRGKGVHRFISTHPDDDHLAGISYLNSMMPISNFYCVKNETTKPNPTVDFKEYCKLRDSKVSYFIEKGTKRKWLNEGDDSRKGAGIHILWPDLSNEHFKAALKLAQEGNSPNDISAIIRYSIKDGAAFVWMGDLETAFMEKIKDHLDLEKANILFAPHHGRDTGKVPNDLLEAIAPDIIVIGEADSKDLNYYAGYNTITQNSAGDITFWADGDKVHIFVSSDSYWVDFLDDEEVNGSDHYIGTLNL